MKFNRFQLASLALLLTPTAFGLSLFDNAPPIGLPESYALRYTASISAGFDDNTNSSSSDRRGSSFTRFSLGASYADFESVTRINYSASLGGTLYAEKANGVDENLFANCHFSMNVNHAFDDRRSMGLKFSLRYTPEPDYSNSISMPLRQGNCFNWHLGADYRHAIDSRWCVTTNGGYRGNIYTERDEKLDDREYGDLAVSLNYAATVLTSYSITTSGRYDKRRHGLNSQSLFLNLGVQHSLSPISSLNASVGTQLKFIDGDNNLYPTFRFGYRRQLADGLSCNAYVSLENENVNTYNSAVGGNYLSDMTWRVGVDFKQVISHKVSLSYGASLVSAQYSKGTNGMKNQDQETYSLFAGMSYRLTDSTSLNGRYTYTAGSRHAGDYYRNVISGGVSYRF